MTQTPVTIDVLLFASAADAFGAPSVRVSLPSAATVADLQAALLAAAARGSEALPPSCRIAVNQRFAAAGEPVVAGDEVALIPPVAGG